MSDRCYKKRAGLTWASLFAVLFSFFSAQFAAADCVLCAEIKKKMSDGEGETARYKELLRSNEKYLSEIDAGDVSKKIKLRSNLVVIGLRLETLRSDLELLGRTQREKSCATCGSGGHEEVRKK